MTAPARMLMTIPEFLPRVLRHRRDAEATFLLRIVTEGSIRLDPPSLDLALEDVLA